MVEQPPQLDEEQLNRVFRALGDPSRRRVVQLLRESGELRVGDLADAFAMSLNGVSKHLKVLERAQLIARRIEGKTHWIRVDPVGLAVAYDWVHAERHYWTSRLAALEANFTDPKEPK